MQMSFTYSVFVLARGQFLSALRYVWYNSSHMVLRIFEAGSLSVA